MINNDRIVPVTKTDLLSLYFLMLQLGVHSNDILDKVDAENANGDFHVTSSDYTVGEGGKGFLVCSEPVKTLTVDSDVACDIYFIPAYDYAGAKIGDADPTGATPEAGSATLYLLSASSGSGSISYYGY